MHERIWGGFIKFRSLMQNKFTLIRVKKGLYRRVTPECIAAIHADGCYSYIHLSNGEKIIVCALLKNIQSSLNVPCLYRVNRSTVINLDFIERIENYKIKLTTQEVIPIPKKKLRKTINDLNKYYNPSIDN